jgi:aspartate aminotransferase
VLNYPSNPTGTSYTRIELDELAEVASRNRVVILSDEIYGPLHHRGDHASIVPRYPTGTVFSGGLSKWCGAGGWRLGLFVVPGEMRWLLTAMSAAASETFTSTSAPIQYAAIHAFVGDTDIDLYLIRCRQVLAALGPFVAGVLRSVGVDVAEPDGAFYLFPDFDAFREPLLGRKIETSADLCERLLMETGVAILPGSEFGRDPHELTARLAYVDFDGADALRAIERGEAVGEAFLRLHCTATVEAAERIADWVQALA